MMILITYDVCMEKPGGAARLRRIAKHCQNWGRRVQYSVFECELEPAQWIRLKAQLLATYKEDEDSLRFYHLGAHWQKRVEHHGAKAVPDTLRDALIL